MKWMPNLKILVEFGGINITWYAFFIVVAILFVYKETEKTIKKWGYSSSVVEDMLLPLGCCILIGARLYYVIFQWDFYSLHPEEIIAFWHGGLAIHGAILGGLLYLAYYCHIHNFSFLRMCDVIFPYVLFGQALGRWGNFFNQEAFGPIVSSSYMSHFPQWIQANMWIEGAYRMPTFLYESVLNGLGFLFIVFFFRKHFYKHKGDCLWMYLVWYGFTRFWIEGYRTDALMLGSIPVARLVSLLGIGIGILGLLGIYHKYLFKYEKPTILFDLDGTLIDSQNLVFETFRRVFKELLPEYPLKKEELYSFFGPTLEVTFEKYFPKEKVPEVIDLYQKINIAIHDEYLKTMPGAMETVKALKKDGYLVGIVSNKRHKVVELGLKISGLAPYMDLVFGKEDQPIPKPNAAGLLEACNQLHVSYDTCVYVGDNPSDILAGKNMAAYTIGFSLDPIQQENLKKAKPCCLVKDLREIIKICHKDTIWRDPTIW